MSFQHESSEHVKIYNQEALDSNLFSDEERQRILEFANEFKRSTGLPAKYVIRSPGRINLIGDHVDYHGFSVLPMAIENSVLIAVAITQNTNSLVSSSVQSLIDKQTGLHGDDISNGSLNSRSKLIVINRKSDSFPTINFNHSFAHGANLDKSHQWHNYVLCAYHGILASELLLLEPSQVHRHAKSISAACDNQTTTSDQLDREHLKHLNNIILFVDSDLPQASGLSSSSALVCASALAINLALQEHKQKFCPINSQLLAESCAEFEHLIGTHGGGMDQAVILTAQEGYAKHVEFMPKFRCSNVHLPAQIVCLVSHCGESFPKAATFAFNSRVLETKLAAAVLLKTLYPDSKLSLDYTITLWKVRDELSKLWGMAAHSSVRKTVLDIIENEKVFKNQKSALTTEFDLADVCAKLCLTRSELIRNFNTSEEFLEKSGLIKGLKLHKRLKHVLEESLRVDQFKEICETTSDIQKLGELMFESHYSLRDNYECSHPALDNLVEVSRKAGALGARLTGAGWGGCIVSIVEACNSGPVFDELKQVSKFTFRSEPQAGATVFKLT